MIHIIDKKRQGKPLSREELSFAFGGYLDGKIPDYQMSALLMAICIKGMTEQEIFDLTDLFIQSGDQLDLSDIAGIKVDKHSTGGVGDKTTMIIGPLVASCNVPFVKMSGRGLGHTGGTIDKLESIPGFRTDLSEEEFLKQAEEINMVVTAQTANLAPMDKKIYALRDVTATVQSIPLIASSVMSKKIASGADKILLDVKFGKGALMPTKEEAQELANIMQKIGDHYHKEVRTLITDMNTPLGNSIGNSLEVVEAVRILKNEEHNLLSELCIELASNMVSMGQEISLPQAKQQVVEALESQKGYQKFLEFVKYQHGDLSKLEISKEKQDIVAEESGILVAIDALKVGELSVELGAGRKTKDDVIDPKVGIVLKKKLGDPVEVGDTLCTLYLGKNPVPDWVLECFTIEKQN